MFSSAAGIGLSCRPADTSDHFTQCNIRIWTHYFFQSTYTYTERGPSSGILISRIPLACGIEDRNGIKETRDVRPPTPFSPKSCLSEYTEEMRQSATSHLQGFDVWAVWILWAFIYFITDPGSALAGGNKADGMF